MSRLPRWAEKFFSAECSLGGAIASGPDEDANGWDFFVEFPEPDHLGPAETAPARRQAFAQVKFTNGSALTTRAKLSNMLKSCSSADPWFVFLITKNKELYGIHVADTFLTRSLKEVRRARLAGKPLHKAFLPIRFTGSDRVGLGGNVVSWMLSKIACSSELYSSQKSNTYQTSGYEQGWGTGKFTLEFDTEDEVNRLFLGLSSGLRLQHFSVVETRFGIPEPVPFHESNGGIVTVQPEPVADCEVKVRGAPLEPRLSLSGRVYAFRLPNAPLERGQVRFSAAPLEIVTSLDGKMDLTFGLDATTEYPLRILDAYVTIDRWSRQGALDIEVWSAGRRTYYTSANLHDGPEVPPDRLTEILSAVVRVARECGSSEMGFSLTDLQASVRDLFLFGWLLGEGSLRVLMPLTDPLAQMKEPYTDLVYFLRADLKEWTLGCVVSRSVILDQHQDGGRQITTGSPKLRDAFLIKAASAEEKDEIEGEYLRVLQLLEENGQPLGFGDLARYIQEQRARLP